MNNYLIFRTDRIGDFLLSLILINSIKRNDDKSYITIVSSKKNYDYIKSFTIVDRVVLLENKLLSKIKLLNKLRFEYYDFVIIHDLKKRSYLISLFLKYKFKIKQNMQSDQPYIEAIKDILLKLKFNFLISDLNTLENRNFISSKSIDNDFILFHFDEKWIFKDYISSYSNIEPSLEEFNAFINLLLASTDKDIVITTGINCPKILGDFSKYNFNNRVKIYKKLNFFDLEFIVSKCKVLISCHGFVSHIAAAHNIKQIDVLEEKKLSFYFKWTKHFRNYYLVYRKNFSQLSNEICELL